MQMLKGDFGFFRGWLCDDFVDPIKPSGQSVMVPRDKSEFAPFYESLMLPLGAKFAFPDIVKMRLDKPLKMTAHLTIHFLIVTGKAVALSRVAVFPLFGGGEHCPIEETPCVYAITEGPEGYQ
jgi:hypothetical protein